MGKIVITGISIIKDEADIVGQTVRHMLHELDNLIIMDHGSEDGTSDILRDIESSFPDRVSVIYNDSPEFKQDIYMTGLAKIAGESGAEWVVPFDADEIWFSPEGRLRDLLEGVPDRVGVVQATMYDHYVTDMDEPNGNPFESMVWRKKTPGVLPKVACRWRPSLYIHQGNHNANYEFLTHAEPYPIEIRHFPYRSAEQMVKKATNGSRGLRNAGTSEDVGGHWHGYADMVHNFGPEALHDWYRKYFYFPQPQFSDMVRDPAPIRSV